MENWPAVPTQIKREHASVVDYQLYLKKHWPSILINPSLYIYIYKLIYYFKYYICVTVPHLNLTTSFQKTPKWLTSKMAGSFTYYINSLKDPPFFPPSKLIKLTKYTTTYSLLYLCCSSIFSFQWRSQWLTSRSSMGRRGPRHWLRSVMDVRNGDSSRYIYTSMITSLAIFKYLVM